ncbi:zona pellucida sperm-binding protein 3 [Nematolebias whitei]|uniref:zona pellucida sperm-binding protein 3 n=1 Tax=Nematolebias whitei TaxID=451745 RepID=UPI00189A6CC2|nr:zona pellucida sperm-binding protein 3 [Nematolebias whitei]
MESMQLIVLSFVLAGVGVSGGFRGVRPPGYWMAGTQSPQAAKELKSAVGPQRHHSSLLAESAGRFHSKWIQSAYDKLKWKFPEDPVEPVTRPPVQLKVPEPMVSNRVAVKCGESKVQVEVSQDLLGIGKLVKPDEITLGGCPPAEIDHLSHVLIFESELHDCGSTLEVNEAGFVYAYKLIYDPMTLGISPITRSQRTVIGVECHYMN